MPEAMRAQRSRAVHLGDATPLVCALSVALNGACIDATPSMLHGWSNRIDTFHIACKITRIYNSTLTLSHTGYVYRRVRRKPHPLLKALRRESYVALGTVAVHAQLAARVS